MQRKDETITDAKGRRITIRGLDLVEQYRLAKALGGAHSQNEVAWSMALTAASVRQIDDVPLPYPTTDMQVEGNMRMIGDEGYVAFTVYLQDAARKMVSGAEDVAAGPLAPPAG